MKSVKKKKLPKAYNKVYPFLLLIVTLFMGICYAQVSGVKLLVGGVANAEVQKGVFISDVKVINNDGGLEKANTDNYYKNILNGDIELEYDNNSSISLAITFYNNTNFNYAYKDITDSKDDENFYSNKYITYELVDNTQESIMVDSKKSKTIIVVFKYNQVFDFNNLPADFSNILKCYLQFNFESKNHLYNVIKNNYYNNLDSLVLKADSNDDGNGGDYEIFSYNGVGKNNVIFGGFCWKYLRTTSTGGTKLAYNGLVADGKCDGASGFKLTTYNNATNKNPSYVGYMYNDTDKIGNFPGEYKSKNIIHTWQRQYAGNTFYYADNIEYVDNKYILKNKDGSEVKLATWEQDWENMKGYYSCFSNGSTECGNQVYYIVGTWVDWTYTLPAITNGKNLSDVNTPLYYSDSYIKNSDGKYELINPVTNEIKDYFVNHSSYIRKFACEDLTKTVCDNIINVTSANDYQITFAYDFNILVGKSYQYDKENNMYKLIDTLNMSAEMSDFKNKINEYRYSCYSVDSDTCSSLYYFTYATDSSAQYVILNNNKTAKETLNDILSTSNKNSTIKTNIDNWYKENLIGYSSSLEDTVFCNDKTISDYAGWDEKSNNIFNPIVFNGRDNTKSFSCKNKSDRFTVSPEKGNGLLTYPVATLNVSEMKSYNYSRSGWYYMMTPYDYSNSARVWWSYVNNSSKGGWALNNGNAQMIPVVSVKNSMLVSSGDGSVDSPYIIANN